MVLNEPEASLHPDLMAPLARLLRRASRACRIVVVSHNAALIAAIGQEGEAGEIRLEKSFGETTAPGVEPPRWEWPKR
jgi:predicted ATPase